MYYHLENEILNLPIQEQLELLEKIIHNLKTMGVGVPQNNKTNNSERKINLRTYPVGLSNPNSTFRRSDICGDYGR